ncbi:hypothetical protein [Streptomyces brevispora]|uniref:Uncharacterized protein n=1 Tax=Streptomyces brevispora TaxID=887462 RepID=A0ABZ1G783_9ACTN|nr:hypothetical protein [Streptomyces brevispora]WSC15366.1 hypothetical protein OIE64_22705 [Streptomyces brevispora]
MRHKDEFHAAVAALAEQSHLSLSDPPPLSEIVNEYHSVCSARQEKGLPPGVLEMEDSVLISAAAGDDRLVAKGLVLASELAAKWPKSRLPLDWISADSWIEGLKAKAGDRDGLEKIISGQVLEHKLDGL